MTTPDATRYPPSMAPIATVVARISAVIAVAVGRIVAIAVAIGRIVAIVIISVMRVAVSIMRIPIPVAIVGITARADVDINLCRCVSRRKHR